MKTSQKYQHLLDTNGISLQVFGIRDIGLSRGDALLAIDFLREEAIPILGGDVYVKRNADIEMAYANWHTDQKPGESKENYLNRSWTTTESYVKSYPKPPDGEPLFALVI